MDNPALESKVDRKMVEDMKYDDEMMVEGTSANLVGISAAMVGVLSIEEKAMEHGNIVPGNYLRVTECFEEY